MKKFDFRLEPVLKYKSDLLEVLKSEHAGAVKMVSEQNDVLQNLKNETKSSMLNFDEKKETGITIAEAGLYERYIFKQDQLIKAETAKLNHLMKVESEKRDKVVEAKKEMLTIEKLRDIKISEYKKQVQKENELFIEEFVSSANIKAKNS